MIKKSYLLAPGPTPIPEKILTAAARPIIHHRTLEFSEIYERITTGLKTIFQTGEDVYILTSTGTGAMEAAVANLLSPGDSVITINAGKFGSRWGLICRAYGIDVHEISLPWGAPYSPSDLNAQLKARPESKAVFATLSETSTGTVYDIRGFSKITAGTDTVLVVDGISGIGAMPCPMDEWGLDVLISGSQKSFMIPPGLAFIAFSPKAWRLVEKASLPRFYFDARQSRKSLQKQTSPWTPGTSLIFQLDEALKWMLSIGLEGLIRHHEILGEAVRTGIQAIGLELLSESPGNILTAVKIPPGIDGSRLVKLMQQKYNVTIAGAQDPHKGEFFRIGHLGYQGGFDMITALSALEMTLDELGYKFESGRSVRAAQNIIKEYWQ